MNSVTPLEGGALAPARSHRPSRVSAQVHEPALDGARGIAILLVLICHFANSFIALGLDTPLMHVARLGWCGVDVFFALSGFLITGILLDTRDKANYFKNFYARRVLRIFPLYYGAFAVVVFLRLSLPNAGFWGTELRPFAPASFLWAALFLQNMAVIQHGPEVTGILTHYWSLAIEEHFYLVWPLLVWLLPSRRHLLAVALGAGGLSILGRWAVAHAGVSPDFVFAVTPLRLDGLTLGAVAAILIRSDARDRLIRWSVPVLLAATALLLLLFFLRRTTLRADPEMWLWSYPLVSLATAAALAASFGRGALGHVLAVAPLRWFGRYSYGLYVWHPIVNTMLFHSRYAVVRAGEPAWRILAIGAAVFAANLVIAWISFHFFEKYFLNLKRHFSSSAKARPTGELEPRLAPGARPT